MSLESLEGFNIEPERPLNAVVSHYDQVEFDFLVASTMFGRKPNTDNTERFQQTVYDIQESFKDCVDTILFDEDLSSEQRVQLLSTIAQGAHESRVIVMSDLTSPDHFEITEPDPEILASAVRVLENPESVGIAVGDEVLAGEDAAAFILHDSFDTNLKCDLETFNSVIKQSPQAKRLLRYTALKERAREVGTIAAGTAVGGIVAGLALKRFSK